MEGTESTIFAGLFAECCEKSEQDAAILNELWSYVTACHGLLGQYTAAEWREAAIAIREKLDINIRLVEKCLLAFITECVEKGVFTETVSKAFAPKTGVRDYDELVSLFNEISYKSPRYLWAMGSVTFYWMGFTREDVRFLKQKDVQITRDLVDSVTVTVNGESRTLCNKSAVQIISAVAENRKKSGEALCADGESPFIPLIPDALANTESAFYRALGEYGVTLNYRLVYQSGCFFRAYTRIMSDKTRSKRRTKQEMLDLWGSRISDSMSKPTYNLWLSLFRQWIEEHYGFRMKYI